MSLYVYLPLVKWATTDNDKHACLRMFFRPRLYHYH